MRSPTSRRALALAGVLSALAFGVAACGDDDEGGGSRLVEQR